MNDQVLACLVVLPIPALLFWMWIRRADRESCDPRPFTKFFLAGAAIGLPLAMAENALSGWAAAIDDRVVLALVKGFAVTALPEEGARALLLAWFIWRRRAFTPPKWIIAVSVALGMGQAVIENAAQCLGALTGYELLQTWVLRSLVCIPVVGFYSLAIGVPAAWRRARNESWMGGILAGLAIAVLAHGLYDSTILVAAEQVSDAWAGVVAVPLGAAVMTFCHLAVRAKYRDIALAPAW